ncbi:MAG: GIY-YIG nuclease family protein [Chitinophagaceae bacterium]|uniref:exonuclease domain-containing protein n=1 Tax=unclassified Paraflavitalea TaxID=2798305 RepID=UPI003D340A5E|nr:GIY-YIG nuclease family protein [Chitinophagaceae bacterium]
MYAIVDIETTGGYASNNDITEVAIVLHNGTSIMERYSTLIKPLRAIPHYIQALTGITPQMVAQAPEFQEVAPKIFDLLKEAVFVAHNVNFDYSFLKHHLEAAGFDLNRPKLCTVRLTKKVFPNLPSYSLGNICRELSIPIKGRHRAGGDADATAQLFNLLLQNGAEPHIQQSLKKGSKEQSLPPHLPKEEVEKLPYTPGVYYFHDQKGKIVYVGKAKNLKYRVRSHFTHNGAGKQRQNFLRTIHSISYQSCPTELMAFILESIEIKRLWPPYNNAQKRFTANYAIYGYYDRNGYYRLAIDKKKKNIPALHSFSTMVEGHQLLRSLIKEFHLCNKLCFMQSGDIDCVGLEEKTCKGACVQQESSEKYNKRVMKALEFMNENLPTFAVLDEGNQANELSCILIEKGRFIGMGYLPSELEVLDVEEIKKHIVLYPENDYIRGLVYSFIEKSPHKKRELKITA